MVAIYVYVTLGLFYLINCVVFFVIHIRKTKSQIEMNGPTDGLVSLFNNNDSISEPLLNKQFDQFV